MSKTAHLPHLSRDAKADEIVSSLNRHGITVLPNFISSAEIDALNGEFDLLLDEKPSESFGRKIEREEGRTLPVIRKHLDKAKYPSTSTLFGSELMRDVAEKYLKTTSIGLNHQIYVNVNYGSQTPVDRLPFIPHFDKISTLKFFLYLTDTSVENGAMGAVPGSQIENRIIRNAQNENDAPGENVRSDDGLTPVEGSAGTLFIFDTDVTHAAGQVSVGHTRRIMRGHTRTIKVLSDHGLQRQIS